LPIGVTVTIYVRVVDAGVTGGVELLALLLLPHDISNPTAEIANAVSSTANNRLRRSVNGAHSSTASTIAPLPCHLAG
jgi:Ca2+/H+ antiporter